MAEFDSAIPPGGQGQVTASIDTHKFKGLITKSVTLTSNDPDNPTLSLKIVAEIRSAIQAIPNDRAYFRGRLGELEPQTIDLVATKGGIFDILKVDQPFPGLGVKIVPAPDKMLPLADGTKPKIGPTPAGAVSGGHSAYSMTLSFTPEMKPGSFNGKLVLHTTDPKSPTVYIVVLGQLEGNVAIRPERLFFFGDGSDPKKELKKLTLVKQAGDALTVSKVEVSPPEGYVTRVVPPASGREVVVEVTRQPGMLGKTTQALLVVYTNDQDQPRIEVPIIAR